MDKEINQKQQILSEKCREHPNSLVEFIHIQPDAQCHKICFDCLEINEIPLTQIISLRNLLESNEQTIFKNYPPLKNSNMNLLLSSLQPSYSSEFDQIDTYLNNFISVFQQAIQQIKQKEKARMSEIIQQKEKLLQNYAQFQEIFQLKNAVLSSREDEIKRVLKEAFQKVEENSIKLQENTGDLNKLTSKLDLTQPLKIQQQMLELVETINFWTSSSISALNYSQQLLNKINLIPSSINNSQSNLAISKNSIHQIEAKTVMEEKHLATFYFDFIQLEIDLNFPSTPFFSAGLMPENEKNNLEVYSFKMAYHEANSSHGISKILKGEQLFSGSYSTNLKKKLEIRIFLKDRVFKFGSFPDYNNVTGLDDPMKIDPTYQYRLGFQLYAPKELMKILSVETVKAFDDKM